MKLLNLIENRLNELVTKEEVPQSLLFEAARHTLFQGGKRLRPLLVLKVAQTYGITHEIALDPACAIEMVHTYSCIHDDLPSMDNDDLRRGQPTLHKLYDEGHAVLTGDYLLTYAFEVLSKCKTLSIDQRLKLTHILAKRSGAHGMIGGQVVDLNYEGKTINWPLLQFAHAHKTAALITAAFEFGGVIANASHEEMKHLQKCGHKIGIAFQIIDDILDKNTGSDATSQKTTATTLLGPFQAQLFANKLLKEALNSLAQLTKPTQELETLLRQFIDRNH